MTPQQAKRQVADHLFDAPGLPAVGGARVRRAAPLRRHRPARRATASRGRSARTTRPRDVCRDHLQAGRDGHGGYAPRFLRHAARVGRARRRVRGAAQGRGARGRPAVRRLPGRQGRLARGRHPAGRRRLPAPDGRASSCSSARSARSRCSGSSSLAVILAQVVALVLLGFAPVALVIGIFPGAGHDVLPQLADQARHRGLHQGAVLARDRDRRRRLGRAGVGDRVSSGSCSRSGCRPCSSGRSSCTASRSPPGWSPATTGAGHDGERLPRMTVVQRGASIAAPAVQRARRRCPAASRQRRTPAGERAHRRHRTVDGPGTPSGSAPARRRPAATGVTGNGSATAHRRRERPAPARRAHGRRPRAESARRPPSARRAAERAAADATAAGDDRGRAAAAAAPGRRTSAPPSAAAAPPLNPQSRRRPATPRARTRT